MGYLIPLITHGSPQTLITLTLANNEIGDRGAEYLANALEQNEVTQST
jgi:hypothetical protein